MSKVDIGVNIGILILQTLTVEGATNKTFSKNMIVTVINDHFIEPEVNPNTLCLFH